MTSTRVCLQVAVQQQRGNPQQAQQAQQQQSQQQQQQQQQQGMAQPTQPQQGMAQQRQQPAGVRLQRVPLSAVLSPLDDFGPGFGRVGGFLRSIEDEMNSMMRVSEAPPRTSPILEHHITYGISLGTLWHCPQTP